MPVIQSLWIGDTLSTLEKLSLASHIAHGHTYHLYAYGNIHGVPDGVIVKDGNEILPESEIFAYQTSLGKGSYSAFSNYFRYKLIYERGGWWADTDVVCLQTFPSSIDPIVATERQEKSKVPHAASCVFYCPPEHALMEFCWNEANKKDRSKIVWGEVGPRLLARACVGMKLEDPEVFCPVDWYSFHQLFDGTKVDVSNSLAIHLWNEMWRRRGRDKDAVYPDSFYESLKSIYL